MDKLKETTIIEEMEKSFLEYSMSVIVSRAIPELRDGLKPVHRRILYTMLLAGYTPEKAYVKSAKTVGAVIGDYHPHGDTAVYDAMVRMAQSFSYRHELIDGHGNFGAIDGSTAAAYRYTEAKISKIAMELVRDINKETVDFVDNYDSSKKEPVVLPSRFPNILVNGTMGIAVGMATNIPPHNLVEVIDGCVAYIENKDIEVLELMEYIKGPDFPTGGSILGNSGIRKAYETGKGSISIRGKVEIEEDKKGKQKIVITEVPYQVNTTSLITRIGELVRDKVIDGIADLIEETSLKNGLRIVIEMKRDANANVVLNNLYKHTQLQSSFGINLLMLHNGKPQTLGLKEIISYYIEYQKEVIYRRTKFELLKAERRAHILEGLKIALNNIDEVIRIIKESDTDVIAKESLSANFKLDEVQSEAILEMKLRRLTGLEINKILDELKELALLIEKLKTIISCDENVLEVVKNELIEIRDKYKSDRKTIIDTTTIEYIEDESLIPVEDIVITLTNNGYIKSLPSGTYKTQNRGGVGVKGMTTNEEDFVEQMLNSVTHDYILFFSNKGKVYRMKGYEIPKFNRQSKGIPVVNLLPLDKEEKITSLLKVSQEEENEFLIFATKKGIAKKTLISDFDNIRNNGKIAINLKDDDELIAVRKTDGNKEIMIATTNGRMVRFDETQLRLLGRTASGVTAVKTENAICVGMEVVEENQTILIVTEKGYGKKTLVSEYRKSNRGSKGVKALNVTEKNGMIINFKTVYTNNDLIICTNKGTIIRLDLENVSTLGRTAQGVRLINIKDEQKVATISLVEKIEEKNEEEVLEVVNTAGKETLERYSNEEVVVESTNTNEEE